MEEAKEAGYDPDKTPIFVDVDASEGFRQWRAQESMTLTRTRAKSGGFYLTSHSRRLTTSEMLKLQGIHPRLVGDLTKIPTGEANASIGNAMSANILERLLPRIAYATGLIKEPHKDSWLEPDFISKCGRFSA